MRSAIHVSKFTWDAPQVLLVTLATSATCFQEFLLYEDVAQLQSGLDYTDAPSATRRRSSALIVNCDVAPPLPDALESAAKVQFSSTHFADSPCIQVNNMSASWTYNEAKLVLEDIHFEVNEVQLAFPFFNNKGSILLCSHLAQNIINFL